MVSCKDCTNSEYCWQNSGVCCFFDSIHETESEIVTSEQSIFDEYSAVQNALNK